MSRLIRCLAILLAAGMVQAQMAHEVLLLVNRNSQDSLKVANTFAHVRRIPDSNVVYLDIPESAYRGRATVTPEEFTRLIWEPANAAVAERGISDRILAWVYSVDFPIRVETDSSDRRQMSVGGLTFLRNRIPELSMVEEGKYLSKLFGGPNPRLETTLPSFSLGLLKKGLGKGVSVPPEATHLQTGLGERMPLPSMMLGYTGANGTSVETVLETIRRGAASDFNAVRSGIYFVVSDDVRSECREWQFYPAVNQLKEQNVEAQVVTNFPAGAENVLGILMGAETVDPSSIKSFAPGAMAEHLTSWSAEFQKPQTKATVWLEAGATATAGAVVEPYSNPDKFPSARFFVHYAAGCTILESFYQSIASPLQNLLLGEPLARPFAEPFRLKVLGADHIEGNFTYMAMAQTRLRNVQVLYSFMLDGKEIRGWSDDPTIYIEARKLSDGYHELRAMVHLINFTVQYNATAVRSITLDYTGRSVSIRPDIRKAGDHQHGIKAEIGGEELPETLRLVCGQRVLDEKPYAEDTELILDEKVIGEGPNRMRIIAVYPDGMEVSSVPHDFEIRFNTDS